MNNIDEFTNLIVDFVNSTPSETIQEVIYTLETSGNDYWELSKTKMLFIIHSPQVKTKLTKLLNYWKREYHQLPASALALSIRTSIMSFEDTQSSIELVWTGPETSNTRMRRTDQALLELIHGANHKLIIVCFAVYKVGTIILAIEEALLRGVEVCIFLEDHEESKGKVTFSGITAFSSSRFRLANFYYWPAKMRSRIDDDKIGALHAKLALADNQRLFVTSANLTEYAMELNMEMGVLIDDKNIGSQIEDLFNYLIFQGVFQKISL